MTKKQRIAKAMNLEVPDRVPVMCQLSIGHYFLQSSEDPFSIWFTSEGFARALVELAGKYSFDGILVNLPGRAPDIQKHIHKIESFEKHREILFSNNSRIILPNDNNPRFIPEKGKQFSPELDDIDPEQLFYIEPWDITETSYPYKWGFSEKQAAPDDFFPGYIEDTLKKVLELAGGELSIHSEVFSPFSQLMELLSLKECLMSLLTDPAKIHACLESLTQGAVCLALKQAALQVDAILISSAYAGGGFLSRDLYREFVLPCEKFLIEKIKENSDVKVYTHTCGAIGDRLDLMLETGTNGIDTLDPPPLGNVKLRDAVDSLSGKAFIKGNMDPVNTLLKKNREEVLADAVERIKIASTGGGYILSSACSVAPHVPPENILCLKEAVDNNENQ